MRFCRGLNVFSVLALVAVLPHFAFATDAEIPSMDYVDDTFVTINQGDSRDEGKVLIVNSSGDLELSDDALPSYFPNMEVVSNKLTGDSGDTIGDNLTDTDLYTSAAAVAEYAVPKYQGTGTNNANVGKALIVGNDGNLGLGSVDAFPAGQSNQVLQYNSTASEWQAVDIDTAPTAGHTVPVTSGGIKTALDGKQPITGVSDNYQIGMAGGTWKTLRPGTNVGIAVDGTDNTKVNITVDQATSFTNVGGTGATAADNEKLPQAIAVKNYADSKIANTLTNGDTSHAPNSDLVYDALDAKQTKPSSVASGQVLTYSGNDANANVTASYVKIPVAAGTPSTNTPTNFVEVWIQ